MSEWGFLPLCFELCGFSVVAMEAGDRARVGRCPLFATNTGKYEHTAMGCCGYNVFAVSGLGF